MQAIVVACWVMMSVAGAGASKPHSAAVMEFSARNGVDAEEAQVMTDRLAASLRHAGTFSRLMSLSDVRAALTMTALTQQAGCDNASCASEIAGALGVDFLVVGNMTRLQSVTIINVKVIGAQTAETVAVSTMDLTDATPEALLAAADGIAKDLVSQGTWASRKKGKREELEDGAELAAPTGNTAMAPFALAGAGLLGTTTCCCVGSGVLVVAANVGLFLPSLLILLAPVLGTAALLSFAAGALAGLGTVGALIGGGAAAFIMRPLRWNTLDKVSLGLLAAAVVASLVVGGLTVTAGVLLTIIGFLTLGGAIGGLVFSAPVLALAGLAVFLLGVPVIALPVMLFMWRA